MDYLHLFNDETEHDDCYENDGCYSEPWVGYMEADNKVSYNKGVLPENAEAWELFKLVFCDNVTDGDKEIFRNYVVEVDENFSTDSMTEETRYNIGFTYTDDELTSRSAYGYSEWGTEQGANVDKTIYQCSGNDGHYDPQLMESDGIYQWIVTPTR